MDKEKPEGSQLFKIISVTLQSTPDETPHSSKNAICVFDFVVLMYAQEPESH